VCLANDGLDAGTVTTVGAGGLIGIGVGYTLGAAATNATRLDQLKGRSMCATLSGELGQQAQGTMCLSMCASGSYTGTWTFYIGVGVGLGTPLSYSAFLSYSVVVKTRLPCVLQHPPAGKSCVFS
jgi:hypothetical protein